MEKMPEQISAEAALKKLLQGFSAEISTPDSHSLEAAAPMLAPGSEVFIAFVPADKHKRQIEMARAVRAAGLEPVPHVVARNIPDKAVLDDYLGGLASEAGVRRALVLGGDRDTPVGEYRSALQLIESGLLQKHGVRKIFSGVYPEAHPRISEETLAKACADKVKAAEAAGLQMTLINQVCFDASAVIRHVRRLRDEGVAAPFRVGVTGPAKLATLLKYALICGVGPSMRALKERQELAGALLAGETPEGFLMEIALAREADPRLGIEGVHFFTFGGLARTVEYARDILNGPASA